MSGVIVIGFALGWMCILTLGGALAEHGPTGRALDRLLDRWGL